MKSFNRYIPFLFLLLTSSAANAQNWTWMHGPTTTNGLATFGTQGVAAAANIPPPVYGAGEWTDQQGNLWVFGGLDRNFEYWACLWKYDVITNQWTWMKGPNTTNQGGVYGTQGVPAAGNFPGSRGMGVVTWTDENGDLWMMGGDGFDMNALQGAMNDLWRYNIATNTWTWMHGGNTVSAVGNYGTFQTPGPTVDPPPVREASCGFTTSANQLWTFAGIVPGGMETDALFRFDIATNQWAWMAGSSTPQAAPVYGTLGVPNAANTPGGRMVHTRWVDHNNNLWIFGGHSYATTFNKSDLWRFNTNTNQWTWMHGPQASQVPGVFGTQCIPDVANNPPARYQPRSSWVDGCDRLWLFGGHSQLNNGNTRSDLWCYDIYTDTWAWADGPQTAGVAANFGTQGVPAATNNPPGLAGFTTAFNNTGTGNLYMFGGIEMWSNSFRQNVWRYQIDTLCPDNGTPPVVIAGIAVDDSIGCLPHTVNFTSTSNTTLLLEWNFGDAPGIVTGVNQTHTYTQPGYYTVTLIALDSNVCGKMLDTAIIHITVADTLPLYLGNDTTLCPGETITLTAGIPGGTFTWSDNSTSSTVNAGPGTWWVTVDYGECQFNDTIVVSQFNIPPTNINPVTDQCFIGHSFDFNMAGVTDPAATYSWSFQPDGNPATASTPAVNGVTFATPGPKTIISSLSQFGCSGLDDTINVFLIPPATGTFTADTLSGCAPLFVDFTADDTLSGYLYFWDFGNTTTSDSANPTAVFPDPGTYTVTLSVIDTVCGDTVSSSTTVIVQPGVTAFFSADPFPEVNAGVFVTFTDSSLGNIVTWQWSFGDGDSLNVQNPTHSYFEPGNYPVTLTVTSDSGCMDTAMITMIVIQDLSIPNVFTPNGDGVNEELRITGFSAVDVFVYDRWGHEVFSNEGVRNRYWDGTQNGKDVPAGVYYVKLSGITFDGERMDYAFSVTLLR